MRKLWPWRKLSSSQKPLKVMKMAVFLLVITMHCTYAHVVGQVRITVKDRTITYFDLFKQIKQQTGFTVVFSNNELDKYGKVEAGFDNQELDIVLNKVLAGTRLTYIIQDEFIILKCLPDEDPKKSITLKGFVYDEKKLPLPGVTVVVVGTTVGTATSDKGWFSLELPMQNGKLKFSFVGYESQEVEFTEKTDSLRIYMKEKISNLEDVIVTGYATIDRGSYVGAVTKVKAEDILVAGESSIDQMLQGQIPGLSVINRTGKVGGTPRVRVRGTSTLLGNQEPLWVVDGVIQTNPLPIPDDASPISDEMDNLRETAGNAISWLNPMDIETITVLKDASATAIYGSQAANGVIVITTKKASGEGLSVSYNGSFSIGQKPGYHLYDMMNSQEYMRFSQELWEDRNSYTQEVRPTIGYAGLIQRLQAKEITREQFVEEFRKMERMNTDWFDLLFRNSFSHNHSLSVSSNSRKVASRFSLGANETKGEAKGNDMLSFTASTNNSFYLKDVIIDFQLNGSFRKTSNFAFGVSPYSYAMNTARIIPMYNEDGSLYYHEASGTTSYSLPSKYTYNYNILNELDNTGTITEGVTLQSALNLRYNFWEHFELQGTLSYSLASNKIKSWATEYSHYITQIRGYEYGEVIANSDEQHASVLPFGGLLQLEEAKNRDWSFRAAILYNNVFNEKHRLTVNLGLQANSTKQDGSTNMRYGYLFYRGETFAEVPKEVIPISGLGTNYRDLHDEMRQGTKITNTVSNTLSEYLTVVYGYNERYIMNLNARLDASNRFGQDKNKRFNPTFSLGVKWRIGNEPFMSWASSWYDMFDISFSYGWRGNAVTEVSPYLIATDGGLDDDYQQYVLSLKSLPYPDLGWEKTEDWNLGIDFSFFQGRVGAGLSFYNKISHVLSSRDVAVEYGVGTAYIDGTVMKNSGYELYISATPVRTENFTWSLAFNTSRVRNKLENNERVNTRSDYLSGEAIVEGEAYGTFYAYAFDGLNAENGRPQFKYMDVEPRENNELDYLVKAGCIEPDISGGLTTSLRYKKLTLRASFAMSFGAQTFLPEFYATSGAPAPDQNAPRYLFNRWRKPGDEKVTNIPAIPAGNPNSMSVLLPTLSGMDYVSPYEMYNQSDVRIANTDFIRCRSIALQYDLPERWRRAIGFRNTSINLSMTNPFFIAFDKAWEGRDPETADWPARRTVSCSLTLSF